MRVVGVDELGRAGREDDLVVHGDNAVALPRLPDGAFDLIYIDPPFNTGRRRERRTLRAVADPDGDRTGFGGRRYRTEQVGAASYEDDRPDVVAFLAPRLRHARRLLAAHGTLYVHLDPRCAYRVRLLLDDVFGERAFLN